MVGETKSQKMWVLVVAVATVIVSVVVTLYASGVLFGGNGTAGSVHQNVTFTDAVLACHERARDSYGERIQTLVTDNHSSRYDNKYYLYKIFLQLDLRHRKKQEVSQNYVNCFVNAGNGKVRKFEVLEAVDSPEGKRLDDGTNVFGIPKKR